MSRQENLELVEEGGPGSAFFCETVVSEALQNGIQASIGAISNDADHLGMRRHEQADSGPHRKAMQRQFSWQRFWLLPGCLHCRLQIAHFGNASTDNGLCTLAMSAKIEEQHIVASAIL
jgi:hypothetical protein